MRERTAAIRQSFTLDVLLVLVAYGLYQTVAYSSYVSDFGLAKSALGYVSNIPFMIGASAGVLIADIVILIRYRARFSAPYSLDYRIPLVLIALCYAGALIAPGLMEQESALFCLGAIWGLSTTVVGIAMVELLVYQTSPLILIILLASGSLVSGLFSLTLGAIPQTAESCLCVAFLIALFPLLALCRKRRDPYSPDSSAASFHTTLRNSSTPIMACAFLELIIGLVNMYAFFNPSAFVISTQAPVQGLIICSVLVFLFVLITNRAPNQRIIYLGVFPGIITIFLLLPFFSDSISRPTSTIIYSAYIFTSMLSRFCYITACHDAHDNIYGISALVGAIVRACLVVGWVLGWFFASQTGGETFVHFSIACVVCVYLLGMVILLWSYRSSREKRTVEVVVQRETFEEHALAQADRLAEEYGLTSRERDVLLGLARGNTAATIADDLCISTSTAQGYIKNLYVKLGVNRKQQVIDLFSEKSADR